MTAAGFVCVTLDWLYDNIEKRVKNAEANAHKKFLAARTIQATYRGWRMRKEHAKRQAAALTIQKNYKMHREEERFKKFVEETLNKRTIDCHEQSAITIQKWWRGYIVRLKVHDHRKLKANQLEAAKELIICIAFKLHHLLRTRVIPGIYSLQNSKALSKVEKLLASFKFKEYNDEVRKMRREKAKIMADATHTSRLSTIKTKIPYGAMCADHYRNTKLDKMISMFDKAKKGKQFEQLHKDRQAEVHNDKPVQKPPDTVRTDVIKSMKRWNIVKDEKNLIVPPNIVQTPENIENFIGEIETICHEQRLIQDPNNICC